MKHNIIKSGVIVLITLAFGFISCSSDDNEPVVSYYGSTTLANGDTITLKTSLVKFNTDIFLSDASLQDTDITDWFPDLKAEGGTVIVPNPAYTPPEPPDGSETALRSAASIPTENSVTLTILTQNLGKQEWDGRLVIPKADFSPALASDVHVKNVKLITGDTSVGSTAKAKDLAANISKNGAVVDELKKAANQSGYIAFNLGESVDALKNPALKDSALKDLTPILEDDPSSETVYTINLKSASVDVTSVVLSDKYGTDPDTTFPSSSVKITSEPQAQLLLEPNVFVSDSSFYKTVEYTDGEQETELKWITISFTVKDAAGNTAPGTITISPEWNNSVYTKLANALKAVNDVKVVFDSLKTHPTTPYATAHVQSVNIANINIEPSPLLSAIPNVDISSSKQNAGAATGVYLTKNSSNALALKATSYNGDLATNSNVKFTNVQLKYKPAETTLFVYNYVDGLTVYITEE